MTPEAQRIAIAEVCGWSMTKADMDTHDAWVRLTCERLPLITFMPDYLIDLNAMCEAEKMLTHGQYRKFAEYLYLIAFGKSRAGKPIGASRAVLSSTAAQRAEAFLRAINKWED